MRVALDTNVLVSALATRGLCTDVFNLVLAEHELIVGQTVLAELTRVLREKIRLPAKVVDEVEALLRQEAEIAPQVVPLEVELRDRSDLPVLSEAAAANASILVTGDPDLHAVTGKLPLRILTPRGFWEEIRNPAQR